jgi:proteic killer suppression protein
MKIRNVVHKGLRRFIEHDDASQLPASVIGKIRKIVTFLVAMDDATEFYSIPGWKTHMLTGDRRGTWSLTVTRNWRITFRIDQTRHEIIDLDYVDYH